MNRPKSLSVNFFESKGKNFTFLAFSSIPLFWLIFYSLWFPVPHDDDLFFIGAAINLAEKGDFVNPLLSLWSDRTIDRFYVQPPFHSYVLGFWLKLFGVSSSSILAFQVFCFFLFSVFLSLLLKKFKFPVFTSLAITLCYGLFMFNFGLRQDGLAMIFFTMGLWLLTHKKPLSYFAGFTFLGSSILTLPVNMVLAIPFGIALVIEQTVQVKRQQPTQLKRTITLLSVTWVLAVIFTFSLFLLSVNFELTRFLDDLSWCASLRRQPLNNVIPAIWNQMRIGSNSVIYGTLYILLIALQIWVIKQRKKQPIFLPWFLLISNISLVTMLIVYSNVLTTNFNFLCWVCVIIILSKLNIPKKIRVLITSLAVAIVLINYSPTFLALFFQDRTIQPSVKIAQDFVRTHPNMTYSVDAVAARVVFDYNLPEGSVAWEYSGGHIWFFPQTVADKPPGMVWILSRKQAWHLPEELPDYPRLPVFGREFKSIAHQPYDVLIVE
ncbi:hypothetical protein K4A83_11760 [Spirulina subsalsa FACHB-351]|uniref:Glycosyltransferase RgtA/B/C/D-like domain-containing protein n=1 Tax=Spirulina subsalsa FACHB-351 TaxID=234711 RepID=A0ABT3L612_9CYAN|nr:hypothetical protein [Spirulina subsalsa]MCW6036934.1 hypothetical protein [Spirulina subsalsa FACHB-351]